MASRPSKFDFELALQSEPKQCDVASRPSKFDFGTRLRSEPGQCDMASRPSKFDLQLAEATSCAAAASRIQTFS